MHRDVYWQGPVPGKLKCALVVSIGLLLGGCVPFVPII